MSVSILAVLYHVVIMQSAFLRDMPLGAVAKAVGLRTKRLENVSASAME
jgi:hypothetical protein